MRSRAQEVVTRDDIRPNSDIAPLTPDGMRGRIRRLNTVFIDDLDGYRGSVEDFMTHIYPILNRLTDVHSGIMAVTSLAGNRDRDFYERFFDMVHRPLHSEVEVRRVDFDRDDHFDNEDFSI
jgi:hypothetical protein